MLNIDKWLLSWSDFDHLFHHIEKVHDVSCDVILPNFKTCLHSFQHRWGKGWVSGLLGVSWVFLGVQLMFVGGCRWFWAVVGGCG